MQQLVSEIHSRVGIPLLSQGHALISNCLLSLDPEHKLFIGMLPKNVSEVEVSALFSKYGTIKDLQILRGSQQTSKGADFTAYPSFILLGFSHFLTTRLIHSSSMLW